MPGAPAGGALLAERRRSIADQGESTCAGGRGRGRSCSSRSASRPPVCRHSKEGRYSRSSDRWNAASTRRSQRKDRDETTGDTREENTDDRSENSPKKKKICKNREEVTERSSLGTRFACCADFFNGPENDVSSEASSEGSPPPPRPSLWIDENTVSHLTTHFWIRFYLVWKRNVHYSRTRSLRLLPLRLLNQCTRKRSRQRARRLPRAPSRGRGASITRRRRLHCSARPSAAARGTSACSARARCGATRQPAGRRAPCRCSTSKNTGNAGTAPPSITEMTASATSAASSENTAWLPERRPCKWS